MNFQTTAISRTINGISYVAPKQAGRLAFALFCYPMGRGKVHAKERLVHDGAAAEYLVINNLKVATYRWGSGEKRVLLVHGAQSRASRFAHLVTRLVADGYSVVSYDAPGHGESEGRKATIVDHQNIIRMLTKTYGDFAAIVAHSFGVLCAGYAIRTGTKVGKFVAVSGPSTFGSLTEIFCGMLGFRNVINLDIRRRTEQYFLPERDIWNRFSLTYNSDELPVELLVIHDEDDPDVSVEHARKITDAYRGRVKLKVTKGLGHRRLLADSVVVDTISSFLGEPMSETSSLQVPCKFVGGVPTG